jgi:DnaK suppressor protein
MTRVERDTIKSRICHDISVLEKSINVLAELIQGEGQSENDEWFLARESNPSQEINEQAHEKAKQRIITLQNVLLKIDSPEYGICTVCKKPIPFERMRAVPSATRCLTCG